MITKDDLINKIKDKVFIFKYKYKWHKVYNGMGIFKTTYYFFYIFLLENKEMRELNINIKKQMNNPIYKDISHIPDKYPTIDNFAIKLLERVFLW